MVFAQAQRIGISKEIVMAVGIATSRVESILKQIETLPNDERRIFHGVTWEEYQELLDELGERRRVLVSFWEGVLEIMPLSQPHEHFKETISRLVHVLMEELDVNIEPAGSTTLQLEALQSGVEPDTSFFIQHAERMIGKETHDLLEGPPPDLVVEIDISRPRYSKKEIYARMRVPEFWQYDGKTFRVFERLGDDYIETESSLAFPFVRASDLAAFLERSKTESNLAIVKSFREWVRVNKPTE
jgi:Uma2 family endonuclease